MLQRVWGAAQLTFLPLSVKIPCPTTDPEAPPDRDGLHLFIKVLILNETHAPPPFWPLWNLQKVDMVSK